LIKIRLPESTVNDKIPAIIPQWKEGSPFRGLSVFNFEHSPVFFGRTKAVSEIIDALRIQAASEKAFILILGMSGGGKSSLVRAGVLPMLTQPGVIEGVGLWRRAIMKPGDSSGDLFDGLAACLLQENALPELGADRTDFKELAKILRETPKAAVPLFKGGLSQAASEMAKSEKLKEHPTARLMLVVDQMEEMFSLESITHEERKMFIEALDALSRSGRVWVIATLRSDFYPRTTELERLVALKEGSGQYDLLAPTPAEIGQMIRQPAQAAGLYFEEDTSTNEGLDDVLRDAAAKNPGALPLLEFTLEELYKQRTDDGMLTYEAYKKLGGVEGALAQRAEEVFGGLEPRVQKVMDVELHSLISIGVDDAEKISRKYAPLEMVTATPETKVFVEAFVKARLFTTDLAADGSAIVNIAHEALLQHWPRLQDWIEKNRESLRIHARINAAASRWENENRSREFLLSAGKQVSEAEELVKNKHIELTDTEKAFIYASIAKSKRIWWIKRSIAAVLVVLTIAASGAAYLAMQQRDRAETEAQTAEQVSEFLVGLFEVSDPSEALGDTITAREILNKGADRIENELGDQPEVQATLMNTMGLVYVNLGLYDQALPLLENALSIRRQLFGGMHPDIATSLNNLGILHKDNGNYLKAEELLIEALAINRYRYGDEHQKVARSLGSLGWIYYKKYDQSKAEELCMESLAILRKIYGEVHPDVANALNILGVLFEYKGDTISEEYYREAFEIRLKIYGEVHPDVAMSLNNVGVSLIRRGNYTEAEELFKKALEIDRKIFGDTNLDIALFLSNLGWIYNKKDDYSKAEELYKESLAIRRKIVGDEHPDVARSLHKLALVIKRKGNYSKAEELYREVLDIQQKILPEGQWQTALTMGNIGDCLTKLKRFQEAEPLLLESYKILKTKKGENDYYTMIVLNFIIELYKAWDKPEKVAECEALLPDSTAVSETQ